MSNLTLMKYNGKEEVRYSLNKDIELIMMKVAVKKPDV